MIIYKYLTIILIVILNQIAKNKFNLINNQKSKSKKKNKKKNKK